MAVNALIFAPATNEPGKRDADEFRREALKFAKHHGIPETRLVAFENDASRAARRTQVLDALAGRTGLDCVAFFCHGWRDGIQAGFGGLTVVRLARALYESCKPGARIPLYCCSLAAGEVGGDGGFADALRDELVGKLPGAVIDAHDRAGHTTRNPYVRRFVVGPERERGGQWIVAPTDPKFTAWRKALADGALKYEFPWMGADEIKKGI